mgnify:FL=1
MAFSDWATGLPASEVHTATAEGRCGTFVQRGGTNIWKIWWA